jgi:hypothetical protein
MKYKLQVFDSDIGEWEDDYSVEPMANRSEMIREVKHYFSRFAGRYRWRVVLE